MRLYPVLKVFYFCSYNRPDRCFPLFMFYRWIQSLAQEHKARKWRNIDFNSEGHVLCGWLLVVRVREREDNKRLSKTWIMFLYWWDLIERRENLPMRASKQACRLGSGFGDSRYNVCNSWNVVCSCWSKSLLTLFRGLRDVTSVNKWEAYERTNFSSSRFLFATRASFNWILLW